MARRRSSRRRISVRQLNLFGSDETDSAGEKPPPPTRRPTMHTAHQIVTATNPNARKMVADNLRESDKWLLRGIVAIFMKQTEDEKTSEQTKYDNGVGFSGVDSQILSSFAKRIIVHGQEKHPRYQSPLSERQLVIARRLMPKYSLQLVRIAKVKYNTEMAAAAVEGASV